MILALLVFLAALIVATVLVPMAASLICSAILLVQFALIASRMLSGALTPVASAHPRRAYRPVFSVHVATHNEPPDLVIATLAALAAQTWPHSDYEVIVMDNNTADPALWHPVSDACRELGSGFRFLHRTGVKGAKAGALNIAMDERRPDATHIVTVDADYVVKPGFLEMAAAALNRTDADYIQFPQAYRGALDLVGGIDAELEEYFRTHARMADGAEAVLLTGTLCVISTEALLAVGGWSDRTITEDAELGVRLCGSAYTGRYISEEVGTGLLPLSLRDLQQQRYRWASGNLQTLRHHARVVLLGGNTLTLCQRAAILSQLTAWSNLSLVPVVSLLIALLWGVTQPALIAVASASIVLSVTDIVARLLLRGRSDGLPFGIQLRAICNRLALAPVSARATFDAIVGKRLTFLITDKAGKMGRSGDLPAQQLLLFACAALAIGPALQSGSLAAAAVLMLMLPLPSAVLTASALRRYREDRHNIGHGEKL